MVGCHIYSEKHARIQVLKALQHKPEKLWTLPTGIVIINPISGKGKIAVDEKEILKRLKALGYIE